MFYFPLCILSHGSRSSLTLPTHAAIFSIVLNHLPIFNTIQVQRLNSQLREVEDNGREGVLFQTAAVVEVTTAASSEIPNKNRDVVLREANTDPSTTPAPPEEDATDTPKLTATTSAPSADTDRPVAAAVNGLSTKPTPVPAAAADAHTEAVVHVEPPVQSREILEGILQQRTREWENEMTERLESEVRARLQGRDMNKSIVDLCSSSFSASICIFIVIFSYFVFGSFMYVLMLVPLTFI